MSYNVYADADVQDGRRWFQETEYQWRYWAYDTAWQRGSWYRRDGTFEATSMLMLEAILARPYMTEVTSPQVPEHMRVSEGL